MVDSINLYFIIYWRLLAPSMHTAWSAQGFSLVQTLHKSNNKYMHLTHNNKHKT